MLGNIAAQITGDGPVEITFDFEKWYVEGRDVPNTEFIAALEEMVHSFGFDNIALYDFGSSENGYNLFGVTSLNPLGSG